MKVRILEDHVVDRIAAGEVVERPASVLKELLENALDAGSTRIVVHLERGGTALVRVVDDGEGMSREDALLAIERHATSKIRTDADLTDLVTLGFRGEALPSIASVSRFRLRTRPAEQEVGHELGIEGGRLEGVREVAMPPGTDIAVRGLFFNTPARRRFLRTVPTELTHCVELVRREVMLRPDLDVTVRHDGRELLRAPAGEDGARRVAELIGKDVQGALRPVDHAAGGLTVRGWVADPTVTRSSAAQAVYTWVGGRAVKDPLLRRAVLDAARTVGLSGRYPVVALRLDVPPGDVDVNVHPAKTEVRFRDPRAVTDAVAAALHAAWNAPGPRTSASPVPHTAAPDLFSRPARPAPSIPAMPVPLAAAPGPMPAPTPRPEPVVPAAAPVPTPAPPSETVPPPVPKPVPAPTVATQAPAAPTLRFRVGRFAILAVDDALHLLDLHAEAAADPGPSRPLLVPCAVPLPPGSMTALLDAAEALEDLGIGIRAFAPGQLAVTALPAALAHADLPALVGDLAAAAAGGTALSSVLEPHLDLSDDALNAAWIDAGWAAGRTRAVSEDAVRAWWDGS